MDSAPLQGQGKKVLCVEDEYFISELYHRALTRAGYDTTIELDGAKGLELAKTGNYDIVLLDLLVPNMTGMDILKHLRDPAESPNFHAKIIITTNLEQHEEVRTQIEQQVDGYIVKANVTPRELVEFLGHLE